ncbi:nucleolin-like isoform X3 [Penaeus japonicus]|uniref:nucleolin-like isoform X3 n=1 Tax=Penaeus japonicus TaxID=27405 RepID=UPI001C7145A4|nr:nucleolin-like isoform X3 [Penaeus japonicus]
MPSIDKVKEMKKASPAKKTGIKKTDGTPIKKASKKVAADTPVGEKTKAKKAAAIVAAEKVAEIKKEVATPKKVATPKVKEAATPKKAVAPKEKEAATPKSAKKKKATPKKVVEKEVVKETKEEEEEEEEEKAVAVAVAATEEENKEVNEAETETKKSKRKRVKRKAKKAEGEDTEEGESPKKKAKTNSEEGESPKKKTKTNSVEPNIPDEKLVLKGELWDLFCKRKNEISERTLIVRLKKFSAGFLKRRPECLQDAVHYGTKYRSLCVAVYKTKAETEKKKAELEKNEDVQLVRLWTQREMSPEVNPYTLFSDNVPVGTTREMLQKAFPTAIDMKFMPGNGCVNLAYKTKKAAETAFREADKVEVNGVRLCVLYGKYGFKWNFSNKEEKKIVEEKIEC